ncbi:hypothetical protein K3181_04375 [Qipengyuania sp. YG27]|uniref:Uncharacterized protein n=1 Tax=Qipengyuania mesophila TaxID=2867246 RepID=A0ABS7JSQ1_9SPHN|nr:hypothetical protein [Qipengyuania mesophila]MBX7500670.1 hypothetical protein [Qipengyuania mesophila]
MTKLAIPALAAALALAACGEADAPETADTAATDTADTTVITPTATETVVADPVETEEGSSLTIDGEDVDATVSEDGVKADINVD